MVALDPVRPAPAARLTASPAGARTPSSASRSAMESSFDTLSLPFVEQLYADFLRDPASVSEAWRSYFRTLATEPAQPRLGPSFTPSTVFGGRPNGHAKANG